MSKASEIQESLNSYDIYNPSVNETVVKKSENPLLIVKINNAFEAEFLTTLCKREKEHSRDIELCVKFDGVVKPLGFVTLCFDVVQSIHEYNPKMKVGLYNSGKFNLLTYEQELCLS